MDDKIKEEEIIKNDVRSAKLARTRVTPLPSWSRVLWTRTTATRGIGFRNI